MNLIFKHRYYKKNRQKFLTEYDICMIFGTFSTLLNATHLKIFFFNVVGKNLIRLPLG